MRAFRLNLNGNEVTVFSQGQGEVTSEGIVLPPGPVKIRHQFEDKLVYRNGWHSWSFAGWVENGGNPIPLVPRERQPMVDHPTCFARGIMVSSAVTAVGDPAGDALLVGALGPGGWIAVEDDVVRGSYPGDSFGWFVTYGPSWEVFCRYVDCLRTQLALSPVEHMPPRVWCSWYSFYRDIDEKTILEVVRGLRGFPIDVVQVDDGWQRNIGDWEENERFPTGLKAIAKEIRKAGFAPGIWLAPFIAHETSALVKKHPQWVLKDGHGEPVIAGENWGGLFYPLDVTNKKVLNWIGGIIEQLNKWGYRYLKLDFLYAGVLPEQGREMRLSPEGAYAQALRSIKSAWGDGYLLCCGAPILPSLGLCNGLRIGPDVAPYWSDHSGDPTSPGAWNAVLTSSSRLWLKSAIHVDPDVVFFRSRNNSLRQEEKRILWDLALVANFKGTSDPPQWLAESEKEALLNFFLAVPEVTAESFYRFRVGSRTVDFSEVVQGLEG